MRFLSRGFSCKRPILSLGNPTFARQINSTISQCFSWPFHPMRTAIPHPASLMLCTSIIARAVNDGPPARNTHSVRLCLHVSFHPILSLENSRRPFRPASLALSISHDASLTPGTTRKSARAEFAIALDSADESATSPETPGFWDEVLDRFNHCGYVPTKGDP
jgi:hypothetical protein